MKSNNIKDVTFMIKQITPSALFYFILPIHQKLHLKTQPNLVILFLHNFSGHRYKCTNDYACLIILCLKEMNK
jgi:hypothetical protein